MVLYFYLDSNRLVSDSDTDRLPFGIKTCIKRICHYKCIVLLPVPEHFPRIHSNDFYIVIGLINFKVWPILSN